MLRMDAIVIDSTENESKSPIHSSAFDLMQRYKNFIEQQIARSNADILISWSVSCSSTNCVDLSERNIFPHFAFEHTISDRGGWSV